MAVQTGSKALRPIWTDVRSVSKIVQLPVTLVPWLKIITFMGSQGGISPVCLNIKIILSLNIPFLAWYLNSKKATI